MQSYNRYQQVCREVSEAKDVAHMPGRAGLGRGNLHKITVGVTMGWQGGKNFHESAALNSAMAEVVKRRWHELRDEALAYLEGIKRSSLLDCEKDLATMMRDIEDAK